MTKSSATRHDPKKSTDYPNEDMSETEEYFKNSSPTNIDSKNSSTNCFEPQNTEKVDDGLQLAYYL